MKKKKRKTKIKPRDISIVALIGKSRRFKDKKVQVKKDVVGRKEKHKSEIRLDDIDRCVRV